MEQRTSVVVAMSGGVDSSVAAALLQQQGYDVIGVMLRLWSEPGKAESNRCCTPEAMAIARRVSAHLGIPFYAIDAQEIFYKTVVKYFVDGYASGETPNPCLVCNRQIRWEFLLDHALAFGAEFMATGHYARLRTDGFGKIQLLRAIDAQKDQSYVLHVLSQEKLKHALFPVGQYTKPEIRQLAAQFNLPAAERPESQDLCFLAGDDYRNFLERNAVGISEPGNIETLDGAKLGEHQGLSAYTIGQRKGLGISSPKPLYVIGKDMARNTLVVGTADDLGSSQCTIRDVHWISGMTPPTAFRAQVKIRYTAQFADATIYPQDGQQASIHFDQHLRDITPGQAAVIYDGDICLGGGIIQPPESSRIFQRFDRERTTLLRK